MYCKRCNVQLRKDDEPYKKCIHCLVKGYKWAMAQLYRQLEEKDELLRINCKHQ